MSANPPHSSNKLERHWLAETVRLIEGHSGPLEDREANRHARAAGGRFDERILRRAEWLAAREDLPRTLAQWRQSAHLVLAAMALIALMLGSGLAAAALEGDHPVNVFWALGSLLGVHLLALLLWAFSLAGSGGGAVGRLWLWLVGRLGAECHGARLGPALLSLLRRTGLGRWGLGALVHAFWLLVLTAALITLVAMLSARRYGFAWETTLLGPDAFITLTRAIGALPALLGFPLPDAPTIQASSLDRGAGVADEAARQAWAGWLLGSLVVYGVAPRLLLLIACAWGWRRGVRRLAIDPNLPEYSVLRERLLPTSSSLGVSDPAEPDAPERHGDSPAVAAGQGAVLIAVELDQRHPWPPALPDSVTDAGVADSRTQRQELLDRLAQSPPARLAVACDPQRSVDRGTLRLIGELSRLAGTTQVWLVAPPAGATVEEARLAQWRDALDELGVEVTQAAPIDWLEYGRD